MGEMKDLVREVGIHPYNNMEFMNVGDLQKAKDSSQVLPSDP